MTVPSTKGRNAPVRTIGPVPDLERHLPPDWWRTLFNAIYLKTDGDVVENDTNTADDVSLLIEAAKLKPDACILDVCCGQGRHTLELARRGFTHVSGLDRSRYLVRLARRRAQRESLKVTFREGDARRFRLPEGSHDCAVLFGNSFGYFEHEEDDHQVLRSVRRVLRPGGCLVLDVVDGDWMRANFEPRSWEWIDQNQFVCRERSLAADGKRLISREVVTHAERGIIADQFYAERLYTYADLKACLEEAGFIVQARLDAPVTQSARQQDLGMMAQRIFIVAHVPEVAKPAVQRGPRFAEVTVLLGDPGLSDVVKRDGQFNPEDLNTVNAMKDALAPLDQFKFSFLDNHANLIDSLQTNPPQFVFNLCDEGYQNDAFKELHVPAILEMCGIPYSGGAPACLALCYNKAHVRAIADALDVPVPRESYFSPDDQAATLPAVFPALLKPNTGDSSQGITKDAVVHNREEFLAYIEFLRKNLPTRSLLVQEFLSGAEYSVGVIGNYGLGCTVLPVLEVDYSGLDAGLPQILGYESKWIPDSPYWDQITYREAHINDDQRRLLTDSALTLFERLECRDYARFDFRADAEGNIKLLEANPNPGWCWDGKLNLMAGFAGYTYTDLLRMILETAQERYVTR